MNKVPLIKGTPWDTAAFGLPTWELLEYSEAAIQDAARVAGHQTIKVDPLADKRLLQRSGFYYCDTLIEPHCTATRLRSVTHADATISKEIERAQALDICHGAFSHGRFHRDYNLRRAAADLRYDSWLSQLLESRNVYGLYWCGALAGFVAYRDDALVLHAVADKYRGKGISKYWWSMVCRELFSKGETKVKSSISAANLPVLNLYCSLGFSFNSPRDVYHRLIS